MAGTALALLAFIFFFERHQPGAEERRQPEKLLAGTEAKEIEAIGFEFPGGENARAERREGEWVLTEPRYPAQQTRLEALAKMLAENQRLDKIAPHEVLVQGPKHFGFDPPRAVLTVRAGTNEMVLQVGAKTPLATNAYVRLEKTGEVFITGGGLLNVLPSSVNELRSPKLAELEELRFDRVRIRSGNRLLELEKSGAAGQWRIARPIPARADQNRVAALFQTLDQARATAFVEENAAADLERFGLQTPEVELSLLSGTNEVFQLEFGGSPTNQPNQVYVRRMDVTNVVLAPKALADFFKQPYRSFHDQRLLSFQPAAADRIVVNSIDEFTVQRQEDGSWRMVEPEEFPADPVLMKAFLTNLLALEIVDFAKEVPAEADLEALGLLDPVATYAIFEQRTNPSGVMTNIVFTEASFGKIFQNDRIHAKRSDEAPIYVVPLPQVLVLPRRAFELRDRQIWTFSPSNLVSVAVMTEAGTRNWIPDPAYGWVRDPIQNAALEELLFRMGRMEALGWVAEGAESLAMFGLGESAAEAEFRVKENGGTKEHRVRFGNQFRGYVYASVILPGEEEPVVFAFPLSLYQEFMARFGPAANE